MIKHVGGRVIVCPRAWSEDWFFFLVLWCLVIEAFQGGKNSNCLPSISLSPPFHSWRVSYVIYLISIDLGPLFVDYVGCNLSACTIYRLLQLAVSPLSWLVKSYPPSVSEPFRFPKAHFWYFGIRGASSFNSGSSVLPTLDGVMAIQRWGFL